MEKRSSVRQLRHLFSLNNLVEKQTVQDGRHSRTEVDCINILVHLKDSHLGGNLQPTISKIPPGAGGRGQREVMYGAFLLFYLYICIIYFMYICRNKTHQKY